MPDTPAPEIAPDTPPPPKGDSKGGAGCLIIIVIAALFAHSHFGGSSSSSAAAPEATATTAQPSPVRTYADPAPALSDALLGDFEDPSGYSAKIQDGVLIVSSSLFYKEETRGTAIGVCGGLTDWADSQGLKQVIVLASNGGTLAHADSEQTQDFSHIYPAWACHH